MVVRQVIEEIEKKLDRVEAFLILEHVLDMPKTKLLMNLETKLNGEQEKKIDRIVQKRLDNEPLQYITHIQYFFGNRFYVNQNVLIPRADTEILVEKVLSLTENGDNILDLCTGSGCIGISLKKVNENVNVTASDISSQALIIAMLNAKINNVKIDFIKSNLFENIKQKFDLIVSNPPYITKEDMKKLQVEVMYEPKLALDGGNDGLDFYRKIIERARDLLTEKGIIALEIGYNQADDVRKILEQNKYEIIEKIKDYGNNDRVIIAKVL